MSTATTQHPPVAEVVKLMKGLFGLDVSKAAAPDDELFSIAEYIDDTGSPAGYMACDLAGGCRLGAALTQVPAGRVDEAVSEGQVPETLAENLDEIFNICVNLVTPSVDSHLALSTSVHGPDSEEFRALKAKMDEVTAVEYGIDIARYGLCRIVIAF